MNSITTTKTGGQGVTTVGASAPHWEAADENEYDLIRLVLAYPIAAASIRNAAMPFTRHSIKDSLLAPVFGACCVLLDNKEPVTGASILETLREWANDPDVISPELAELAEYALPRISTRLPRVGKVEAIHKMRELAALIHKRNETEAREFDGTYKHTTGADLAGRITATQWLWQGYIPRGYMTLLVADQDQGKSTVALDFCRTVLSGSRWPDGKPNEPQPNAKLLWIDTEGAVALWYERAIEWKVPVENFIFPEDGLEELRIDNPCSWQWIEDTIDIFDIPLVVVDSLSGAHSGKENDADEMKVVCKKLASLAARTGVAMVVVHHLNKPNAAVPDYPVNLARSRGSSAITQFCRSVLALGTPDKNRPDARRLDVIKLNLAKKPAAVGYELTAQGPAWGAAPEAPKQRRSVDDAADFLQIALKDGPRPSDDIHEEARENSIGDNAIKDAKKLLGITTRREGGKDGRWFMFPKDWKPANLEAQ